MIHNICRPNSKLVPHLWYRLLQDLGAAKEDMWAIVTKLCYFMNISLNSWAKRGLYVFDQPDENVWLPHCSKSFCEEHLKPLP